MFAFREASVSSGRFEEDGKKFLEELFNGLQVVLFQQDHDC